MSLIVTRFAPSPTGRLHVGNIRTALHNWMWARKAEGRFLLRLDDTDLARSTEEFADAIRTDLAWLGLMPDDIVRQSERFDLYERRFQELRAAGRVYPAYETAQELDLKRKILAGRGLPPIYDRAALKLSDEDRARLEAEGIAPHWRFKLDHDAMIEWDDLVRGAQHLDPKLQSDPVIRRADGSWLYMLPSVIDDIDMGVTHVVRGEDHVTNTGLQLQMFAALGAPRPPSRMKRFWWAARASSPSGSVRSAAIPSARKESSHWRSPPCSRGSGRAIRSNPSPTRHR
jgi:glutamyl-tRNA synthetase